MDESTREYINSWRARISNINGDNLNALFEKFSAYYTMYNRFYNDSFRILGNQGRLTKPRYSDFEKATSLVVFYNSADDILNSLRVNGNLANIDIAANLIEDDIFHINLVDGTSQRGIDLQLMQNLRSEDNEVKAQAVLSLIYNVRSNILHGEKHFDEYQRLLLEPLINLLRTIVALQEDNLS